MKDQRLTKYLLKTESKESKLNIYIYMNFPFEMLFQMVKTEILPVACHLKSKLFLLLFPLHL